jgi:hypothetical protein
MRKFKLVKTYPGSPELGFILTSAKGWGNAYYSAHEHPEFWEEIIEYPVGTEVFNSQTHSTYIKKEDGWYKKPEKIRYTDEIITKANHINVVENKTTAKDYEILSWKYNDKIFAKDNSKTKDKLIYCEEGTWLSLIDLENDRNNFYKIYSVKRLSDGEIFTVGDNTNAGTIKEFSICGNTLQLKVDGLIFLDNYLVKHIKQPLFKTEDGVNLFEGDECYLLHLPLDTKTNLEYSKTLMRKEILPNPSYRLIFSTKEKAEKYILMNKPCLSLQDIKNFLNQVREKKSYFKTCEDELEFQFEIEKIAKSKL